MTMEPKKSLGQHWLEDRIILESICDIAVVQTGDEVLEIGPGKGTLTKVLIERGAIVTAVEFDGKLAEILPQNIGSENLKVVNQDILKFNLNDLPAGYKVVANIPYYLTSNLIRVLSESNNPAKSVTLLVQKEVAERICAGAGEMSVLGVSAQTYFDCNLGPVVEANKFFPPPKVDSQVVHMVRKLRPFPKNIDSKIFFQVVKAGFSNRRKTLLNSLSGGLHLKKDEAKSLLSRAGIKPSGRAQELMLDEWFNLAEAYSIGIGS